MNESWLAIQKDDPLGPDVYVSKFAWFQLSDQQRREIKRRMPTYDLRAFRKGTLK